MTSSLTTSFFFIMKQMDSMLPRVYAVLDHRKHQNVVRTSVTHSAAPCVQPFCCYHILTSSIIGYQTDTQQHGLRVQ